MRETVESVGPGFGVRISGWSGDIGRLARLLDDHHLVVLEQVGWTEATQLRVTRALGPIVARRPGRLRRPVPNVRVELGADRYADRWHADLSWSSTDAASLLACVSHEPAAEPTSFADTATVFDRLGDDPALASLIAAMQSRTVRHDLENSRRLRPATVDGSAMTRLHRTKRRTERHHRGFERSTMIVPRQGGRHGTDHPLVDATAGGQQFLRLGDHAWSIEGLAIDEAAVVLDRLTAAATEPRFVYTHHWVTGDAVVYDNRMMLHRRSGPAGTDPHRRLVRTMAARPLVSRRRTA